MRTKSKILSLLLCSSLLVTSNVNVNVLAKSKDINVTKSISVMKGDSLYISVKKGSKKVRIIKKKYKVTSKKIAKVSTNGKVIGKKAGKTTVKVTVKYKKVRKTYTKRFIVKVKVTNPVINEPPIETPKSTPTSTSSIVVAPTKIPERALESPIVNTEVPVNTTTPVNTTIPIDITPTPVSTSEIVTSTTNPDEPVIEIGSVKIKDVKVTDDNIVIVEGLYHGETNYYVDTKGKDSALYQNVENKEVVDLESVLGYYLPKGYLLLCNAMGTASNYEVHSGYSFKYINGYGLVETASYQVATNFSNILGKYENYYIGDNTGELHKLLSSQDKIKVEDILKYKLESGYLYVDYYTENNGVTTLYCYDYQNELTTFKDSTDKINSIINGRFKIPVSEFSNVTALGVYIPPTKSPALPPVVTPIYVDVTESPEVTVVPTNEPSSSPSTETSSEPSSTPKTVVLPTSNPTETSSEPSSTPKTVVLPTSNPTETPNLSSTVHIDTTIDGNGLFIVKGTYNNTDKLYLDRGETLKELVNGKVTIEKSELDNYDVTEESLLTIKKNSANKYAQIYEVKLSNGDIIKVPMQVEGSLDTQITDMYAIYDNKKYDILIDLNKVIKVDSYYILITKDDDYLVLSGFDSNGINYRGVIELNSPEDIETTDDVFEYIPTETGKYKLNVNPTASYLVWTSTSASNYDNSENILSSKTFTAGETYYIRFLTDSDAVISLTKVD